MRRCIEWDVQLGTSSHDFLGVVPSEFRCLEHLWTFVGYLGSLRKRPNKMTSIFLDTPEFKAQTPCSLWLQKFDEVGRCHRCLQVYKEVLNYNSSLVSKIQGSCHMVILYMCSLSIVVLRHAKPLPDAQLVRRKIHLWSFDKEDMKKILLIHFEVLWTCPCLSFGPSLLSLPSPAVSPIFHAYTAYTTLRHVVPLRCCVLWRPCPASLHLRYSERSQVVSVAFQAKLNGSYSFKVFKVLEIWLFFCNVMYLVALKIKRRVRKGERRFCWGCLAASSNISYLVDKSGGGCCSFMFFLYV